VALLEMAWLNVKDPVVSGMKWLNIEDLLATLENR
jgi:hypothetical protein